MINIVIMAGGKGERFWPRSTQDRPKQFHKIVSDKTMLQETFNRIYPEIKKENIFFIANEKLSRLIKEQIPEIDDTNLIIEPFGRNTAAAIGLAAIYMRKMNRNGTMVILTADHVVKPKDSFIEAIDVASKIADDGYIVTFGIKPDRPATEYGYIETGESLKNDYGLDVFNVKMFREKPDRKTAEEFIKKGNFYWNSGMFAFKVSRIIEEIKIHVPKLYEGLIKIENAIGTESEEKVKRKEFEKFDDISIDYAVMEKAKGIACVIPEYQWDDVGSWNSIYRHRNKDENGNIKEGNTVIVDTKNTIVLGDEDSIIAVIGVEDLVIVKNEGRILICNRNSDQRVKEALKIMKQNEKYRNFL